MIYVAVLWLGFFAWAFWGRPTAEGKRWPIATAVASGLVLMLLALSGCGPARRAALEAKPEPEILATLRASGDSSSICRVVEHPGWYGAKTQRIAREEAQRDGLGDCSEDHARCVGWGFAYGTPGYSQCRLKLETANRAERAAQSADDGPTFTHCVPAGTGMVCNSF